MTAVNVADYYAGDDYVHEYTVRDERAKSVDLTGASARWALSPVVSLRQVGEPIYVATSAREITFPAAGKLRISVPKNTILTPGEYVHELELTLATGQSQTIATGKFTVKPAALLAVRLTALSINLGAPALGTP